MEVERFFLLFCTFVLLNKIRNVSVFHMLYAGAVRFKGCCRKITWMAKKVTFWENFFFRKKKSIFKLLRQQLLHWIEMHQFLKFKSICSFLRFFFALKQKMKYGTRKWTLMLLSFFAVHEMQTLFTSKHDHYTNHFSVFISFWRQFQYRKKKDAINVRGTNRNGK